MGEKTCHYPQMNVVVDDKFNDSVKISVLRDAIVEARRITFMAHITTLDAIKILTGPEGGELSSLEKLADDFRLHVRWDFLVDDKSEYLPVLRSVEEAVRATNSGLNNHNLVIRQWGTRPDDLPSETGAAVGGWVPNNFLDTAVRALDYVSPGGCLNVNYANNEHIVVNFEKLKPGNEEWVVDTLIHEATHKFYNSRDFTRDPPWKRAWEWARDYKRAGFEPILNGDWAKISQKQALHNAYGLTNYMQYMPEIDLKVHANLTVAGLALANRAIRNFAVFDSISNDSL